MLASLLLKWFKGSQSELDNFSILHFAYFGRSTTHFGGGEKAEILWNCSVLAVFLLLWMEKYKRIFGDYSEKEVLWGKVGFWTSNSLEFWDIPFYSFCGMEAVL